MLPSSVSSPPTWRRTSSTRRTTNFSRKNSAARATFSAASVTQRSSPGWDGRITFRLNRLDISPPRWRRSSPRSVMSFERRWEENRWTTSCTWESINVEMPKYLSRTFICICSNLKLSVLLLARLHGPWGSDRGHREDVRGRKDADGRALLKEGCLSRRGHPNFARFGHVEVPMCTGISTDLVWLINSNQNYQDLKLRKTNWRSIQQ